MKKCEVSGPSLFAIITLYKGLFCKVLCKIAFLIRENLDITQFAFCKCSVFKKPFLYCVKKSGSNKILFLCVMFRVANKDGHITYHNIESAPATPPAAAAPRGWP